MFLQLYVSERFPKMVWFLQKFPMIWFPHPIWFGFRKVSPRVWFLHGFPLLFGFSKLSPLLFGFLNFGFCEVSIVVGFRKVSVIYYSFLQGFLLVWFPQGLHYCSVSLTFIVWFPKSFHHSLVSTRFPLRFGFCKVSLWFCFCKVSPRIWFPQGFPFMVNLISVTLVSVRSLSP